MEFKKFICTGWRISYLTVLNFHCVKTINVMKLGWISNKRWELHQYLWYWCWAYSVFKKWEDYFPVYVSNLNNYTPIMVKYSKEQRAWIVESYFTLNCSPVAVRRSFAIRFGQQSPSKQSIISLIAKFRETGSSGDKRRCGRPKSIRNEPVFNES